MPKSVLQAEIMVSPQTDSNIMLAHNVTIKFSGQYCTVPNELLERIKINIYRIRKCININRAISQKHTYASVVSRLLGLKARRTFRESLQSLTSE